MLTVISPAKRLDFTPANYKVAATEPEFQQDAISLNRTARRLSAPKLRKLMSISQDLAKLNQARFKAFLDAPSVDDTKPAALAFAGDTYIGLEATSLSAEELTYAQSHLRILSGLYGLLRPMDQIQPYRLEMGSRLATRRGKSLYQYWGNNLSAGLNQLAEESNAKALVNCASVEYFGAVPTDKLKLPVVTPVFLDMNNGEAKIVSFFAKRARGAMARFIVQNRVSDPEGLKDFDTGGYKYQPDRSEPLQPVFLRDA